MQVTEEVKCRSVVVQVNRRSKVQVNCNVGQQKM